MAWMPGLSSAPVRDPYRAPGGTPRNRAKAKAARNSRKMNRR